MINKTSNSNKSLNLSSNDINNLPNKRVYLSSDIRSTSKQRRNKIFTPIKKSRILSPHISPNISSRVVKMQKQIDDLATTLFCRQKREQQLENNISKALTNKNDEVIRLQKKVLDMYDRLRAKDSEIELLQLQVKRVERCSKIIQQNKYLENIIGQSEARSKPFKSTNDSFRGDSRIVSNYKTTWQQSTNSFQKINVPSFFNQQILSPFSVEQNQWKI